MSEPAARIFTTTLRADNGRTRAHKHIVTEAVECHCGCTQDELFPIELAYQYGGRSAWAETADGVLARSAFGHSSLDPDQSDDD
jgi:hypothetical protein